MTPGAPRRPEGDAVCRMQVVVDEREEIRGLVRSINEAWRNERLGELAGYLHDGMVMVFPGFSGRCAGKVACIDSYRAFARQAEVRSYDEDEVSIDLWDRTAVATYRFRIEYDMGGRTHRDEGRDVLVFNRGDDGWQAVWRTMVPSS